MRQAGDRVQTYPSAMKTVRHNNIKSEARPTHQPVLFQQFRKRELTQYKVDIALERHGVQQTGIFLPNIYEMCFKSFRIGRGREEKTYTQKRQTAKDTIEKLTLVIWAPKLEGFAFKTSAENVTSQRGKKKVKNKQEWKRKKNKASITT